MPKLRSRSVQVWRLPLRALQPYQGFCFSVMTEDEQEKSHHYRYEEDKNAYILTRGTLRCLLSYYTGQIPQAIRFYLEASGKPSLGFSAAASLIEFNVSHTREQSVIAISDFPVGVDIESKKRDLDPLPLAKRFFHPGEYEALCHLPLALQKEAFIYTWVCKEAWVKAQGTGIADNLKDFEVNVDPAKLPAVLQAPDQDQWRYWPLEIATDHQGVLVVDTRVQTLSYYDTQTLLDSFL